MTNKREQLRTQRINKDKLAPLLLALDKLFKQDYYRTLTKLKSYQWNQLRVTSDDYKGGIVLIRAKGFQKVAVYFYKDDCIAIEDKYGTYSAQELREWLMDDYELEEDRVDLDNLKGIPGIIFLAHINEDGTVELNEKQLKKFNLISKDKEQTEQNKQEITDRLTLIHNMKKYVKLC